MENRVQRILGDSKQEGSPQNKGSSSNYVLLGGELYRKGLDGLLLKCPSFPNSMEVIKQVHEGVCRAHQSEVKMCWLIRRHGYFWPTILKDFITYSKDCQQCQKYGSILQIPTIEFHLIV